MKICLKRKEEEKIQNHRGNTCEASIQYFSALKRI